MIEENDMTDTKMFELPIPNDRPLVWMVGQETVEVCPSLITAFPEFDDDLQVIIETDIHFPFPAVAMVRVYVIDGVDDVLLIGDESVNNLDQYAREDARLRNELAELANAGRWDEVRELANRWTS
jgi:hypothetical protein